MSTKVENVVIVGTGCAGLTAAIYTGRANLQPLVLEGSVPGGQLTTTSEVENFPGFPEGVDGFQLMQNLRKQAEKFGTRYESGTVQRLDTSKWPFTLRLADREIRAKSVIVATGASPRMTGIPGEKELFGGKGVTTCATCDGAFYRKMDVAVLGGGDSAAE
jgi:thioredoxin reductase (NADPH)